MVGLKKAEAGSDVMVGKKEKKESVVSIEDSEEEWGGICEHVVVK